MKVASYNGQFVGIIHKHSNGLTTLQYVKLRGEAVASLDTAKWDFMGLPIVVRSGEIQPLEFDPKPIGLCKRELTGEDISRLNAARGLDLLAKGGVNRRGLRPSVRVYNLAIKTHDLAGALIEPVVA